MIGTKVMLRKFYTSAYDPNYDIDIEMSIMNGTSRTNLHNSRKNSIYPWWNSCNYTKKIMSIKANFYKCNRYQTNSDW